MKLQEYTFTKIYMAWTNISRRKRATAQANIYTQRYVDIAKELIKSNYEKFHNAISLRELYDIKAYLSYLVEVRRWQPLTSKAFTPSELKLFQENAEYFELLYTGKAKHIVKNINNKLYFYTLPGLEIFIDELYKIERPKVKLEINTKFIKDHPEMVEHCIKYGANSLIIHDRIHDDDENKEEVKVGVRITDKNLCLITLPRFATALILRRVERQAFKIRYGHSPEKEFVNRYPDLTLDEFEKMDTPHKLNRKSITTFLYQRKT